MKEILRQISNGFSFPKRDLLYALRNVVGAILPLLIGMWIGETAVGVKCTIGASFVFGVDREESLNAKVKILTITALLASLLTLVMLLLSPFFYIKISLILVVIFVLSFIASLGVRYAMMAFMGYLSILISISLTEDITYFPNAYEHTFWVFMGSVWYILFGVSFHLIFGKKPLVSKLDQLVNTTAGFIQNRGALMLSSDVDPKKEIFSNAELRMEVTEVQNELREMLLTDIGSVRKKDSLERQVMMGFIELVDMFEMAISTPIQYEQWHEWLEEHPSLKKIPQLSLLIAATMKSVVARRSPEAVSVLMDEVLVLQEEVKAEILTRNEERYADTDELYQKVRRIQMYQKYQIERLQNLYFIYIDQLERVNTKVSDQALQQFKDRNPLRLNALLNNFTFASSSFRYALRTSITAIVGYLIGYFLELENSYWIMLTVLVIMKPGYSVTKLRFIHRILGTFIGAVIALILAWIGVNATFLYVLLGISILLGFSYINTNYVLSSLFFTLFIVGLYGALNTNLFDVIFYRFTDTLIGGVLCFLSIQFLFPFWEEKGIGNFVRYALKSSENYLKSIAKEVENKDFNMAKYKLARKDAFVGMSNLIASYKRLKTDPKGKQENATMYAEVILLNEALLSTLSSLAIGVQKFQRHIKNREDVYMHFKEVIAYFEALNKGEKVTKKQALLSEEIQLRDRARKELEEGEKGTNYKKFFHGKFVHDQLNEMESLIYQLAKMR